MKRIIVNDLSKDFKIGFKKYQTALARILSFFSGREPKKVFWALKKVSFDLESGEILGIIGRNGSGKSTLLRILAGIYPKYEGKVKVIGNKLPLIAFGSGFIDRLSLKENTFLVGSFFGLSQKTIKKRFGSIVEFAGLEDFVNTKLYQFSSGMRERLAFSIAIHSNPDILFLDEVFAVGDEDFRRKSAEKIKELVKKGASAILVSHELWMVGKYCDRVLWIDEGKVIQIGKSSQVIKKYLESLKDE